MSELNDLVATLPEAARAYLEGRKLDEVECIISDLPGIARGKAVPATKYARQSSFHLPLQLRSATMMALGPRGNAVTSVSI